MSYLFDSLTTRMPNGVTNAAPWQTMGAAGVPDPSWAHVYHNDFDTYAAGDWVIADTGTVTRGLVSYDGGALSIATDAVANDGTYMHVDPGAFALNKNKQAFFKINVNLSDATNSNFWCGLVVPTGSPASPSDGVFLQKSSSAGTLTLVAKVGGTTIQSVALPAACTIPNNTFVELGISIDQLGNIAAYFNPTTGCTTPISAATEAAGTAIRGRVAALYVGNGTSLLTTTITSPSFYFTTTTAAPKTMLIDYITAVRDR